MCYISYLYSLVYRFGKCFKPSQRYETDPPWAEWGLLLLLCVWLFLYSPREVTLWFCGTAVCDWSIGCLLFTDEYGIFVVVTTTGNWQEKTAVRRKNFLSETLLTTNPTPNCLWLNLGFLMERWEQTSCCMARPLWSSLPKSVVQFYYKNSEIYFKASFDVKSSQWQQLRNTSHITTRVWTLNFRSNLIWNPQEENIVGTEKYDYNV